LDLLEFHVMASWVTPLAAGPTYPARGSSGAKAALAPLRVGAVFVLPHERLRFRDCPRKAIFIDLSAAA
jgi:hypothetical protein